LPPRPRRRLRQSSERRRFLPRRLPKCHPHFGRSRFLRSHDHRTWYPYRRCRVPLRPCRSRSTRCRRVRGRRRRRQAHHQAGFYGSCGSFEAARCLGHRGQVMPRAVRRCMSPAAFSYLRIAATPELSHQRHKGQRRGRAISLPSPSNDWSHFTKQRGFTGSWEGGEGHNWDFRGFQRHRRFGTPQMPLTVPSSPGHWSHLRLRWARSE
jgi:hypothetical protein